MLPVPSLALGKRVLAPDGQGAPAKAEGEHEAESEQETGRPPSWSAPPSCVGDAECGAATSLTSSSLVGSEEILGLGKRACASRSASLTGRSASIESRRSKQSLVQSDQASVRRAPTDHSGRPPLAAESVQRASTGSAEAGLRLVVPTQSAGVEGIDSTDSREHSAVQIQRWWRTAQAAVKIQKWWRERKTKVGGRHTPQLLDLQAQRNSELVSHSSWKPTRTCPSPSSVSQGEVEVGNEVSVTDSSVAAPTGNEPAPTWLRLWAVTPLVVAEPRRPFHCWVAACYRPLVVSMVLVATAFFLVDACLTLAHSSGVAHFRALVDCVLGLGTLIALAAQQKLHRNGCELLGAEGTMLVLYAQRNGFDGGWGWQSRQHSLVAIALWAVAVVMRAVANFHGKLDLFVMDGVDHRWAAGSGTIAFAIVAGMFTAMVLCLLHITNALVMMVDSFCGKFMEDPDIPERIQDWNEVQALLRRASGATTPCFLALHTTALVIVGLGLWEAVIGEVALHGSACIVAWLIAFAPAALAVLQVGQLLPRAAEVTSRCARAPAFINSLDISGLAVDIRRQYMVDYVVNSDAGFYVNEAKLTGHIVMKLAYLVGIGVLTVTMRVASAQ
mmetsp:Transcript_13944/g.42951  ORF Transcript_13944/g.42951 Transcript_13944/m.42951 type:complete len:614 (+) Transcript_13944:3-1844(+)